MKQNFTQSVVRAFDVLKQRQIGPSQETIAALRLLARTSHRITVVK